MIGLGQALSIALAPQGPVTPPFVGPLDALKAQGATFVGGYSCDRLLGGYTGAWCRLRGDGTGSPEADIGFDTSGLPDTTAAAALIASGGGSNGFFHTWYDQTAESNAGQDTTSSQPYYSSIGGVPGMGHATATRYAWLNADLSAAGLGAYVWLVVEVGSTGTNGAVAGTTSVDYLGWKSDGTLVIKATGGGEVDNAGIVTSTGRHYLHTGATSYATPVWDGTTLSGGSLGTNTSAWSGYRLGCAKSGLFTYYLTATAGSRLVEFIMFKSNPTGLAGWTDFVNNRRARFSLP